MRQRYILSKNAWINKFLNNLCASQTSHEGAAGPIRFDG